MSNFVRRLDVSMADKQKISKNRRISFSIFIIIIIIVFSCNRTSKDSHPEYFDKVFKRYDSLGNSKESVQQLDSSFSAFSYPGTGDRAEYYIRKCAFYINNHDYLRTVTYADSLILLPGLKKTNSNYKTIYARAFFYKGDAYIRLKNFDKAFESFITGRKTLNPDTSRAGNTCELFQYTARLANLNLLQAKFSEAAGYYKQVCKELQDCPKDDFDKFVEMQGNLDNVALSYSRGKEFDSANVYFNKALDFIDKNGNRFPDKSGFMQLARAVIYGNQAEVYIARRDYKTTEELLRKSITGTKEKDTYYSMSTLITLAHTFLLSGEVQRADSLLIAIRPLSQRYAGTNNAREYYKVKSDYYVRLGKMDSAFANRQRYFEISDSLQKKDEEFNLLNVKGELERWEQKSANDLLVKDNELKKMYLAISAVVSLMAVIILLLLWQNLRRSARHVAQLELLNKQVSQKNEDLQAAFQSLEQSHAENSRIIRIIAHDLKNPISVVNNLAASLIKKDESPFSKNALPLIQEASANSLALINDILAREKSNEEIGKEIVNMKKLLDYCVNLLQVKAAEKKQKLRLEAEEVFVKLNRQKIWRVISNIINNAIKFSPENSDIDIRLQKNEKSILVSVQDYGIGIPVEMQDKIFSMAGEARRTGTSGEESYGLGLSISRKIVAEHNGSLWFTSIPGKGSVFNVELPM